jgi:5'-methylthioadenosine phosphorylase
MKARVAVIGGSGLYQLDGVRVRERREVPTPWGLASDALTFVEIGGDDVVFLPRHGLGHRYLPSEVPSKANIWALKSVGVEQILALSAVGSLTDSCAPGDFVLCDNLIDKTTRRP